MATDSASLPAAYLDVGAGLADVGPGLVAGWSCAAGDDSAGDPKPANRSTLCRNFGGKAAAWASTSLSIAEALSNTETSHNWCIGPPLADFGSDIQRAAPRALAKVANDSSEQVQHAEPKQKDVDVMASNPLGPRRNADNRSSRPFCAMLRLVTVTKPAATRCLDCGMQRWRSQCSQPTPRTPR